MLLFVYYSTTLNNTNISILSKDKAPVSINGIEAYNKKTLNDEIRRLIAINVQLMINKIETEKVKVNLETDRIQLFNEKNSLVVKREEFRAEIATLNITGYSNVLICSYQNPFFKLI